MFRPNSCFSYSGPSRAALLTSLASAPDREPRGRCFHHSKKQAYRLEIRKVAMSRDNNDIKEIYDLENHRPNRT